MKIMTCPINGPRPISEFVYGGAFRPMPDPDAVNDVQWADYVFNRSGAAAVKLEWWCHSPSTTWFMAERDTARDVILRTFLFSDAATATAIKGATK